MLQKRDEVSARHNSKDQLTKTTNQIVRYLTRLRHRGVIFHQHCVSELLGIRDLCLPDLEQTTHCSSSFSAVPCLLRIGFWPHGHSNQVSVVLQRLGTTIVNNTPKPCQAPRVAQA